MKKRYRPPHSTKTTLTAVTGYPLGHTWSPQLHSILYNHLGIDAVMLAFPQENIASMIQAVRTLGIPLLAVTLPHKQEVMNYLDDVDDLAKEIGAVNTVINRGGKLFGYNTDVVGIAHALKDVELKGKNVLILGAGGAARPLCWFLRKQKAKLFCYNRTAEKAEKLMKEFDGEIFIEKQFHPFQENIRKSQRKKPPSKGISPEYFDLIINATPVGMGEKSVKSPLPQKFLRSNHTVFDLIYNPLETQLLRDAKKTGAKTISGIHMLVAQALEQVRLWTGKKIDKKLIPQLVKTVSHQ